MAGAKYAVDFIGTFLFSFTIGMVVIGQAELVVFAPFAIGSALMCWSKRVKGPRKSHDVFIVSGAP